MSETKADGCGVADCPAERALKWAQIDLAAARHERDKLRAERDEARRNVQAAQEDNRKLCLEAAQAAAERDRLAERVRKLLAANDAANRRNTDLIRERDELAGKVAGLTQDVELMRADRDAVAARAKGCNLAVAEKIDELRANNAALIADRDRHAGRAVAQEAELVELRAQVRKQTELAADLRRKLGDARAEVEEFRRIEADAALYIVEDGQHRPKGSTTRVPLVEARAAWLELRSIREAVAAAAAPLKPAERFIEGKLRRTEGPTVTVLGRDGMGYLTTDAESVTIKF